MRVEKDRVGSYPFLEHEKICLPTRTKKLVKIKVTTPARTEGYIRRVAAGPVIYLIEAIASNQDGYASLFVINSNDKNVKLIVPPVELENYESITRSFLKGEREIDKR